MKRYVLAVVALALGLVLFCGPYSNGAPDAQAEPGDGTAAMAGSEAMSAATPEVGMQQVPEGYEQILKSYDGRYTKAGWNHYGPGYFELDPATGILTSHGGMGLFWYSVKHFSDFVLELDFKCTNAETNSGVFVRVPGVPTSDDYIYHSFEIQIYDAGEGIHLTGAAYDAEAPTHLASNPPGEWNHFKITFAGSRLAGGAERPAGDGLGGRGPWEGRGLRAPGVHRSSEPRRPEPGLLPECVCEGVGVGGELV